MKRLITILFLLLVSFIFILNAQEDNLDKGTNIDDVQEVTFSRVSIDSLPEAKNMVLYSTKGQRIKLKELQGKPIILFFWASWDRFSKKELDVLIEIKNRYQDKDFEIVAVAIDERKAIKAYLKDNPNVNFPVFYGSQYNIKQYNVWGLPAVFLIDRSFHICQQFNGYITAQNLEREIKKVW